MSTILKMERVYKTKNYIPVVTDNRIKVTPEKLKQIFDLKASGLSLRKIGSVVGISGERVRTIIKRYSDLYCR